jgi:uncharacterized protein (DUF927 family)
VEASVNKAIQTKLDELDGTLCLGEWNVDDRGVWKEEPVYGKGGKVVDTKTVIASPIPVLPVALLINADSGIEKVQLSFFKRGRWQNIVTERSITANRNNIIKLSDKGLEVNSDNAVNLVRYISEVIAQSLYCMPQKPAKSVMGWAALSNTAGAQKADTLQFMPYTDDLLFDGDEQFGYLYKAISERGNPDEWIEFVRPLRSKIESRLCMAASFASPIIELIGDNPFVFHLWGKTGSGKTVLLMLAMSIFGNPAMGAMTRTMNMTANSMLSTAAFLKNLPFAGDELQTIKSRWTNYDNLIMCITEGIDRGRMTYDKVNEIKAWKCSFIFSGEEPCIKAASGGGAKNRVIECECSGKLVENGNATANFLRTHYGTAGKILVQYAAEHIDEIRKTYADIFESVLDNTDTTDKQAGAISLMMTADRVASSLFWSDEPELTIDDVKPFLFSAKDVDASERAYQFVCDTISSNIANFSAESRTVWGKIADDCVYLNKTVLRKLLADEGYDFEAVKMDWCRNGYIQKKNNGEYRTSIRINGIVTSCIRLILPSGTEWDDYETDTDELLPY